MTDGQRRMPYIEVDGREPDREQLAGLVLSGYGHFTAMQVRDQAVQGLVLHMGRLSAANRELFGEALDGDHIRSLIRHALGEIADASVRVLVQSPDPSRPPTLTVVVRPRTDLDGSAWTIKSVPYQRSLAHLKHLGDFGQGYYGRLAERDGFDEALLTGTDGLVSEGSITNVGFFDRDVVVWPAAPVLAGITMQLLQAGLASAGRRSEHRPVRVVDIPSLDGMFVCNSWGVSPIARVDDQKLPVNQERMAELRTTLSSVPWDSL